MKYFIAKDVQISRHGIATVEAQGETKEEAMKNIKMGCFSIEDFEHIDHNVQEMPDIDELKEENE